MRPALRTEGLGRRYGRLWALRDCSVDLREGTVTALIGPNGAGKTTLLQLVVGLMAPSAGVVRLFGEPMRPSDPAMLAKVGFVAQGYPLYRGLSVADLLRLAQSLNQRWDHPGAERRLQDLGIPLRCRAGKLSGGQQAQVALTLALAKQPRLLVLDEPVASLDPVARRDFLRGLMDAVAADGLTVLLSSHAVTELERVCDQVVLLREGRVQLFGQIEELLSGHRLLVGPRTSDSDIAATPGVLRVTHGTHHTNLLMKIANGAELHPSWRPHPVSFEELVVAYLEQPVAEDRS